MNQLKERFFSLRKFGYRHPIYSRCPGISLDLLPRRLQSSRFIDLRQHIGYFHFAFSVICINTSDYRAARCPLAWTGRLLTLMRWHRGISFKIRLPHSISGPFPSPLCFGSAARSLPPLVHDFPSLVDALKRARSGIHTLALTARPSGSLPRLIVRVLSSTLLPDFIGPESSVLPVDLSPCAPPRFGISSSSRFVIACGNLQRHNTRASLGKTHHLPVSRPASCRFGAPDIRPRFITPARPPHQHHIAGSLFATYTDSASCFLQTPHCC